MGRHEGRLDAWHGSVWPARCILASPPATAAVQPARTVPGAASPAPPGTPAVRDPRHLFPPSLLQAQQERSAQQAQSDVVMPARPEPAPYSIRGAGLVLVQPHVALFRLKLRFYSPTGATHVGQGLQGSVLRSIGQVVAGFAAVQVPAVNGPVDVAGLPPAGWTHPLRLNR